MSRYEIIWQTIREVPRGRVASYGQIATIAGMDGHARLVGYALHALPAGSDVPWHRIISSAGRISLSGPSARRQRKLLESEGIRFSPSGRIDFSTFGYRKDTKDFRKKGRSV